MKGITLFSLLAISAVTMVTSRHDLIESVNTPVVRSKFEFAVSLMRQLIPAKIKDSEIKENTILSAPNIFRAFLTLYLGADGRSKDQLAKALHIEKLEEKLILEDRKHSEASNTLSEADRLYHDKTVAIKRQFHELVKDDVEGVDFQSGGAKVTDSINQWVSDKTLGRIPKLFGAPLSPDTRIMILSTVYFKGQWIKKFIEEDTKKDSFTNHKGELKQVDMMFQRNSVHYDDSDVLKCQIVSLPYTDSRYSFVIFLPHSGQQTIGQLIDKLSVDSIHDTIHNLNFTPVHMKIPKFKINSDIDLKTIFQSLGASDVFEKESAKLDRMTDEQVYVNKASHVATIGLNENGTVATAATSLLFTGSSPQQQKPFVFTADHPFLYMIYDKERELPIFTGVIIDL